MPAMTMVFRADEEVMARLAEGQNIEFVADRVEGKLTVVELK
jgi:Cu/Ag efflux protein CusF